MMKIVIIPDDTFVINDILNDNFEITFIDINGNV